MNKKKMLLLALVVLAFRGSGCGYNTLQGKAAEREREMGERREPTSASRRSDSESF